jgi:hypothetical protein
MGGKVLEYEAKTILRKGISQGRQEGLEAGRRESCIDMLRAGMIKISDAAKYLNMSEEELKTYL